jgi:mannosylglycerate hydrolase MGH1-like protein
LESDLVDRLPGFKRRLQWFVDNRPDFREHIEMVETPGGGMRRLLSIVNRAQLPRVLRCMLDEGEFLSPHGIRALSERHREQPYTLALNGIHYQVRYEPAESSTGLFGGNSNWRGPVWFPVNYLLIEALQKLHYFFGDDLKVECPTGSGQVMNLWDVAAELSRRLTRIFLRNGEGARPVFGGAEKFQHDPQWRDYVLFYEYFHGDNGAGLGASHQTGWTGLVAKLLQQSGE